MEISEIKNIPALDKRTYTHVKFKNKLELIYIYDAITDMSGASICVNFGSIDEKKHLPSHSYDFNGIAHLLEHLIFIENEEYPKDKFGIDYLQKIIKEHNGLTNAFTANNHTCYYIKVIYSAFLKILNVFLHSIFSSKFDDLTFLEKEKQAVHNEYKKNIAVDIWKIDSVIRENLLKEHPLVNFHTGNCESLFCENTLQKEKKLDADIKNKEMFELVKKMYDTYYVGENMKVVIYHSQPWEDFIKNKDYDIEKIFNKKASGEYNKRTIPQYPFNVIPNKISQVYEIEPVFAGKKVILMWYLNREINEYEKIKPIVYLSYFLQNNSEDSLQQYLIKKKWITNLFVISDDGYHEYFQFYIIIELTDEFVIKDNIKLLIAHIIKYIQDIPNKVESSVEYQNFFKKKLELEYEYNVDYNIKDVIVDIAENMFYVTQIQNILSHKKDYEYDIIKLKQYFLQFDLSKATIVFLLKSNIFHYRKKDGSYFQKKYSKTKFHNATFQKTIVSTDYFEKGMGTHPLILSTSICEFLPKELKLLETDAVSQPTKENYFWLYPESTYKQPKYIIQLLFKSELFNMNPHAIICMRLLSKIINQYLSIKYYNCLFLGYQINTFLEHNVFGIYLYGYNDKLEHLLEKILLDLKQLNADQIKHIFFVERELFKQILENKKREPLYSQFLYKIKLQYINSYIQEDILMKLLDKIEYQELIKYVSYIFNSELECFLYGNFSGDIKNKIKHTLDSHFSKIRTPELISLCDSVKHLQSGDKHVLDLHSQNNNEENNLITFIYECQTINKELDWKKNTLVLHLIDLLLENTFYSKMRTEKQFAYIAKNSIVNIGNIYVETTYYIFLIQSGTHELELIEPEMKLQIDSYKDSLQSTITTNLTKYKEILKKTLKIKKRTQVHEFNYFYGQIVNNRYEFNIENQMVSIVDTITEKDVFDIYDKYFSTNKKLIILKLRKH